MIAPDITPSEWELMRIIWTSGEIPTRDIIALAQQKRDWSESTIKTLLARLTKKGYLTATAKNRKFFYTASIRETTAMDDAASNLFDHLCSMKKGGAIINLVENQKMTRADIETLQNVLERKLKTAPESIACDCLPNGDCGC
ncbi:MAG: CopY/TcrY family copper transport repressor [Bifidobacteriaceae bacterium]|jgi:CopY/TcrY family copper transport repressor|nr:CopY/TcrY family copper transport repressor [Bifidobacteriaceae bacterium]